MDYFINGPDISGHKYLKKWLLEKNKRGQLDLCDLTVEIRSSEGFKIKEKIEFNVDRR